MINELQPKASYYDLVLQNKSLLSISKIAKDYGMSGTKMNKLLHELGIQFKQGNSWLLYQKYADKGYTQSKTHAIDSEKSRLHTYWTQKGRLFIYETLKSKRSILPIIEREERAS
nr:phage antirepressor KilAC domain-containing protein [Bacillus safensis]